MNEKMKVFNCIVQCHKCNCSLIEEIEKIVYFSRKPVIMQKTCRYLDNLECVPKLCCKTEK